MADRDSSRITITFPDMDYDGDGTVDATSSFVACVFSGPTWSGFTKNAVKTTCSNDSENGWGNLIETYRAGTLINYGTITIGVDWDITDVNGGKVYGAFQSKIDGNFTVTIPAAVGETTGPVITIPGTVTNFTPQGEVLADGDDSRFAAEVVIQIKGEITFTAPT